MSLLRFAKKAALLFLVASSIGSAHSAQKVEPAALLSSASHVLDGISRKSENAVPDAVLNRTKCFVVIPHLAGGTAHVNGRGVANCRETPDRWSAPFFIKFRGHGLRAPHTDLLVFILSSTGARMLRSGKLQIRGQKRASAPLVSTTQVTTQLDLTGEFLTYAGVAGVLSGSEANGIIGHDTSLAPVASDRAHSGVVDKTSKKYLGSVVSFFNTITPTGIVIHHTAVIPGEKTAPRKKRDIDKYHQARGFEILCFGSVYHMAYHYLILPNGKVQAGRPERCEGAHAEGYNSYLGISVVGDFSSEDNPTGKKGPTKPSDKQIAALIQLCRRLQHRYNIPLQHIVRHSDISSTKCPGNEFPFRAVLHQLELPGGVESRSR